MTPQAPGPRTPDSPDTTDITSAEPAEPQWLSEEEMRAWLPLIGMTIWLPSALDAQLQREAGITLFEYGVMAALSESEAHTMRMSDLAARANASLSRLSRGVARLEQRDWVRRSPDPQDGRYTLATLTELGWEQVRAMAPGHVAEARRLVFDALTPGQVRQLGEIGRRIMRTINPDGSFLPNAWSSTATRC